MAAMEKLGADGVTNVTIRGVTDDVRAVPTRGADRRRPRRRSPGADEVIDRQPHPRAHRGTRPRPDVRAEEEPPGQGRRRLRGRRLVVRVGGLGRPRPRCGRRSTARASSRACACSSSRRRSSTPSARASRTTSASACRRCARRRSTRSSPKGAAMFVGVLGTIVVRLLRRRRDDRRDDHDVRAPSRTASARSARCARSASRARASSSRSCSRRCCWRSSGGAVGRGRRRSRWASCTSRWSTSRAGRRSSSPSTPRRGAHRPRSSSPAGWASSAGLLPAVRAARTSPLKAIRG